MEYIAAVLPSISIGIIFWLILRWIFRGDRTERTVEAMAQDDAARWYDQLQQRDGKDLPFGHPTGADNKHQR